MHFFALNFGEFNEMGVSWRWALDKFLLEWGIQYFSHIIR